MTDHPYTSQVTYLYECLCTSLGIPCPTDATSPSNPEQQELLLELSGTALLLQYNQTAGCLTVTTIIGEMDEDELLTIAPRLLEANMVWEETQGSTLCLTEDHDAVVMRRWVSLEGLDLPALRHALERHLSSTNTWQNALPQLIEENEGWDIAAQANTSGSAASQAQPAATQHVQQFFPHMKA